MSGQTVASHPLDEAIMLLVRARAHGRGYTDLHLTKDLPRMVAATSPIEPTPRACKASLRRLVLADRIIAEWRAGGVFRFRPLDGEHCPVCGGTVR